MRTQPSITVAPFLLSGELGLGMGWQQIATSRSKHTTKTSCSTIKAGFERRLGALPCFRCIRGRGGGGGDDIQRLQFHEYKAGLLPLSLSFQIFSPCGMRHFVPTEPSKKNGGDRLCLVTFFPHRSELASTLQLCNRPSLDACRLSLELIFIMPSFVIGTQGTFPSVLPS